MNTDEIKKLAYLARIDIDKEVDNLTEDLNKVLEYVEVLEAIDDLTGDEQGQIKNVFRDDLANDQEENKTESILSNAPDSSDDFIKVGKVLK